MNRTLGLITVFLVVLAVLPAEVQAFGAGDIPDFAYLNGKAFRHGDIEGSLENLVKYVGSASLASGFGSSSFFGFAKHVVQQATAGGQGPKFSPMDVKRVYFGNWLRDFSQACDIAGLSKLAIDSIVLLVAVLGFVDFGFATEEFQVTKERLGVYLTVEHIDNPKGYAKDEENEDARKYDPRLRPPVNPRELDIDGNTGMKKYMATEGEDWDTSTACIRRNLIKAIELGRSADGGRTQGATLWEAYRLLGTGMHTLEDLLAHSNWCELALRKMGREEVFCHVGDEVLVTTPSGERVPPLVTGTFGGADFMHSMLGEATDKLSQSSVTELKAKMDDAKNNEGNNALALKAIISKLNLGGGDKMGKAEEIHEQSKAYSFNPDNIAPPEVQHQFLELLRWRDDIYREVLTKLEIIPGLMDLVNELSNALTAYVYAILAPYISPLLERATAILGDGSKAVIDSEDQYEVFDNPSASDPSHSLLSKDHFGIILNEPAGLIAMVVVENTVNLVVQAWNNNEDPHNVVNKILEAFHHPYYATGESSIQHNMFDTMQKWFGGLGGDEGAKVISQLTKESVRRGNNKRAGTESSDSSHVHGPSSYNYGKSSDSQGNYTSAAATQYGGEQSQESYNSSGDYKQTYGGDSGDFYGSSRASYGSSNQTYGSSDQSYDRSNNVYDSSPNSHVSSRNTYASVGDSRDTNYSSSRRDEQDLYGSGCNEYSSGPDKYSSSGYADRYQPSYSRPEPSYDDTQSGYSRGEYGGTSAEYGGARGHAQHEPSYSRPEPSYENTQSGYSRGEYGGTASAEYGGGRGYAQHELSYSDPEPSYEDTPSGYSGGEYGGASLEYGGERGIGGYEPSRSRPDPEYGGPEPAYGRDGFGGPRGGAYGHHREEPVGLGGGADSGFGGPGRDVFGGPGSEGGFRSYRDDLGGSQGGFGGRPDDEFDAPGGFGGPRGPPGGYGRADDTFGAERLNISEDDNPPSHHGHHGHRHHDEY